MLFVIAMMIEDESSGSMSLVQDAFVGVTEDEALGKAFKLFKGYGHVHSYKVNFVADDVSEKDIKDLQGIDSKIVELLNSGQKILAIKRYRELSGDGLRESKEAIDDLLRKHDNLAQKYSLSIDNHTH